MNLAEIRKKAGGAKDAAKATVADHAAVVETAAGFTEPEQETVAALTEAYDLPEMELDELAAEPDPFAEPESFTLPGTEPEEFSPDADFFAAAENDETSMLPTEMFADLDHMPTGDPLRVVAILDDKAENKSEAPLPQEPAPQSTAAAEPVRTTPPKLGAAPVRKGYNPLAVILSGREEAEAVEAESSFQLQPSSDDVEEYLCFRVAAEEYALNIMSIKEIIKPREVTEVPRMPGFISGVISLRGVIIPVMDMRLRLSLPMQGATGRERVIVLRIDSGFCGVLVDEVVQVARIRKSDIEEPPAVLEEIDRDFVRGLGHFDNRMLIILNLETITDISIQ